MDELGTALALAWSDERVVRDVVIFLLKTYPAALP
jgi:hypothetical protein